MATPVSEQEYKPILAWTQLLATLQMVKIFFIYQACFVKTAGHYFWCVH